MSKYERYSVMFIVFAFVLSIILYPYTPILMATHWTAADIPDRFLPRSVGVFAIPLILLLFYYLFRFLPALDPYSDNIKLFKKHYEKFLLVLIIYFFYIHFITIIWNSGIRFHILQLIAPAFGLLLYYLGVTIAETNRNYLIGIANPWSLHSEELWKKTHIFAAKIFKTAGIFTCFGFIFYDQAMYFILTPLIFAVVYSYIYSYQEFTLVEKPPKKNHKHRKD